MQWPPPPDWPMAAHSELILSAPHRWHLQIAGQGADLLLIHGAGGATQSWRHLFPLLAQHHRVIAIDLPGQGFTQSGAQRRFGLDATAQDLLSLIHQMGWSPRQIVGHSAGAAVALRLVELGLTPDRVTGLNAALANFRGVAGWLFPMLAKTLAATPLTANVFSATVTPAKVHSLIAGTGSVLDAEGEALYLRLCRDRGHVDATLSMMAQWSLDGLLGRLPQIDVPVQFLVGTADKAVRPDTSDAAAARMANAQVIRLDGLGHLAHEEDADRVAAYLK